METTLIKKYFKKNTNIKEEYLSQLRGISIDSRQLKKDQVFLAIKGKNLNGCDFIEEAEKNGAMLIIANKSFIKKNIKQKKPIILVKDTIKELQSISKFFIKKIKCKKIAITGSTGKTTTKDFAKKILVGHFGANEVFANEKNFNNQIGVSLSALNLKKETKISIFELGMNNANEIKNLCDIVEPEIGLITNIGNSHVGNLKNLETIAQCKTELWKGMSKNNCIGITNSDDKRCVRALMQNFIGKKFLFGKADCSDLKIVEIIEFPFHSMLKIKYNGITETIKLNMPGKHNAYNLSAAISIALSLNVEFCKIINLVKNIQSTENRLSLVLKSKNKIVISDTYNASPESVMGGLRALSKYKKNKTIAILGEMSELGKKSNFFHETVGSACAYYKISNLIGYGKKSKLYGYGAIKSGMNKNNFHWEDSEEGLINVIQEKINMDNVAILLKGSRRTRMEEFLKYIAKDK